MKNDMKIILGAIVVILLLLVGAYALSGSNNAQPSATPTVLPVTATPTPVPGGSTVTPAPTVTPSVAPTATPEPTVTPTPVPESGVKLTEFGYWITYPPLGPQKWSTNPRPSKGESNVVYFNPTSGTISLNMEADALGGDYSYIETTVYREGDMNGTVNVTIHATSSDNIEIISYLSAEYDYYFSMHADDYEDLIGPDENGDYVLTFGPGVTEQELCLHIDYAYYDYDATADVDPDEMPEGQVTLTITKADGGYVPGPQDQYMLNVAYVTEVRFGTYVDQMYYGELYAIEETPQTMVNFGIGFDGYIDHIAANGSFVDVFVPIARQFDIGELTVYFDWSDEYNDFAPGDIIVAPYTFPDGYHDGLAKVSIPKDYVLSGTDNGLYIYFVDNEAYLPIDPDYFDIYINNFAT